MLFLDLMPSRTVEKKGSVRFMKVVDSKYQIPSRYLFSENLIPDMFLKKVYLLL